MLIGCRHNGQQIFKFKSPEVPQVGDVLHVIEGERNFLVEHREWGISAEHELSVAILYLEELPSEQEKQESIEGQEASREGSKEACQEAVVSELCDSRGQLQASQDPKQEAEATSQVCEDSHPVR